MQLADSDEGDPVWNLEEEVVDDELEGEALPKPAGDDEGDGTDDEGDGTDDEGDGTDDE